MCVCVCPKPPSQKHMHIHMHMQAPAQSRPMCDHSDHRDVVDAAAFSHNCVFLSLCLSVSLCVSVTVSVCLSVPLCVTSQASEASQVESMYWREVREVPEPEFKISIESVAPGMQFFCRLVLANQYGLSDPSPQSEPVHWVRACVCVSLFV